MTRFRAAALLLLLCLPGTTTFAADAVEDHIRKLEVHRDVAIVMGMETDADDATIVRSTIDLAHNLGLSVVAEGVENAAILERLRALGCDEVQGYHISRPMPAPAFMEWLRK